MSEPKKYKKEVKYMTHEDFFLSIMCSKGTRETKKLMRKVLAEKTEANEKLSDYINITAADYAVGHIWGKYDKRVQKSLIKALKKHFHTVALYNSANETVFRIKQANSE